MVSNAGGLLEPDAIPTENFAVPLALIMGFIVPTVLGITWGDPIGAYVWGGLVARLTSKSSTQRSIAILTILSFFRLQFGTPLSV